MCRWSWPERQRCYWSSYSSGGYSWRHRGEIEGSIDFTWGRSKLMIMRDIVYHIYNYIQIIWCIFIFYLWIHYKNKLLIEYSNYCNIRGRQSTIIFQNSISDHLQGDAQTLLLKIFAKWVAQTSLWFISQGKVISQCTHCSQIRCGFNLGSPVEVGSFRFPICELIPPHWWSTDGTTTSCANHFGHFFVQPNRSVANNSLGGGFQGLSFAWNLYSNFQSSWTFLFIFGGGFSL